MDRLLANSAIGMIPKIYYRETKLLQRNEELQNLETTSQENDIQRYILRQNIEALLQKRKSPFIDTLEHI